ACRAGSYQAASWWLMRGCAWRIMLLKKSIQPEDGGMAEPVQDTRENPKPRRSRRRWLRRLIMLPFALALLSVLQVAALRFIDPPFTAFMAARQVQAWTAGDWDFRVAYDWRDRDAV